MLEEVWGIRITPNFSKPEDKRNETHHITFELSFEMGKIGQRNFVSTPTIREFAEKHKPGKAGSITLTVHPSKKLICGNYYFPFSELEKQLGWVASRAIEGKGVASKIERQAIRFLAKKYPGFTYQEPIAALESRRAQLSKRRMCPGWQMPIRDFWKKLQHGTRAWKARKRLK